MKAQIGDVIEFICLSWTEAQWEFDHPVVVLKPILKYSPNGDGRDNMIEDMAFDLCCGDDIKDEDCAEEFKWRHWNIKTLNKVAKDRLTGKDPWCTRHAHVTYQKLEFYDQGGQLEYRVLETKEK